MPDVKPMSDERLAECLRELIVLREQGHISEVCPLWELLREIDLLRGTEKEWRIVSAENDADNAPTLGGQVTKNQQALENSLAILNEANPKCPFKIQYRTPAGPWKDKETKA